MMMMTVMMVVMTTTMTMIMMMMMMTMPRAKTCEKLRAHYTDRLTRTRQDHGTMHRPGLQGQSV